MIELNLTNKQARKMLAALNGPSVVDLDVAAIYEHLKRELDYLDSIPRAPWRKVVRHDRSAVYWYDVMECGHRYQLRQSSRAGKAWIEDHAAKRRCQQCFDARQR